MDTLLQDFQAADNLTPENQSNQTGTILVATLLFIASAGITTSLVLPKSDLAKESTTDKEAFSLSTFISKDALGAAKKLIPENSGTKWPKISLSGTGISSLSPEDSFAIVNGKRIYLNQQVKDATLVQINQDSIVLQQGEEIRLYRVKE